MASDRSAPSRQITERLLAALASRDLRRIEATLSPDCSWRNVPHPVVDGRDAVLAKGMEVLEKQQSLPSPKAR